MRRLPFFLWLVGIIGVTSFPLTALPEVEILGMDKLIHFFLFSVLGLFYFLGFANKKRSFLLLVFLFAFINELSQYYVPGRFVSAYDFVCNLSGLGISYWVLS